VIDAGWIDVSSGQIAWQKTCIGFQRVATAGIDENMLAVVLDEERDDRGRRGVIDLLERSESGAS
jgi:hypothetical protein